MEASVDALKGDVVVVARAEGDGSYSKRDTGAQVDAEGALRYDDDDEGER